MGLGYANCLVTAQSDGTALTNSTTATSLLPGQAKLLLPGGYLSYLGQMLTFEAAGRISTLNATPGTLQFTLRTGPTSTIAMATSPLFALNVTTQTNITWRLRWDITVAALGTGTSANVMHTGDWLSQAIIGSPGAGTGGAGDLLIPASAPAVGTGFDSTVDNTLDLFAQWGTANPANSILLHQYRIISWN